VLRAVAFSGSLDWAGEQRCKSKSKRQGQRLSVLVVPRIARGSQDEIDRLSQRVEAAIAE
jgi:hypothetical protein